MAMHTLYDRALRAWYRFCAANGYYPDQPSASSSEEMTAIPADDLCTLCDHSSGQRGEDVDQPLPSLTGTFAM